MPTSVVRLFLTLLISRSSSETANIGTVTAANVPLDVDFEDYNYWGFEGGQRFFFSRVRFTPFVGYLVGLNRFDDIRGTFVNVPASLSDVDWLVERSPRHQLGELALVAADSDWCPHSLLAVAPV
jgi:hypothetical protein